MSRHSAALSFATQHAMRPEITSVGAECLNIRFPLRCGAEYSVKPVKNDHPVNSSLE